MWKEKTDSVHVSSSSATHWVSLPASSWLFVPPCRIEDIRFRKRWVKINKLKTDIFTNEVEIHSPSRQNMLSFHSFLHSENLSKLSMFSITVEALSHGNTSISLLFWSSSFLLQSISVNFQIWTCQLMPVSCSDASMDNKHVFGCARNRTERKKKKGERERESPSIHWAHFTRLNNSPLTEWGSGRVTRWCHDSHCQTTEADTHLVCEGVLCGFACECVCLWMCICILQRLLKSGALRSMHREGQDAGFVEQSRPHCVALRSLCVLSNDLVSWMGNRPFVGEALKKRGAISMHPPFRPLCSTYSLGGLSLVSQTTEDCKVSQS